MPSTQEALRAPATFEGPRFTADRFISFDGAALGLTTWPATAKAEPGTDAPAEPWAVIIGLHGMNDYAETFYLAGPYWAARGVTTYAYDARGFGRSPGRGLWPGEALMAEDLRTAVSVARRRHPHAVIAVVGASMGAAETIVAFAGPAPPAADRVVLAAPAVWGWSALPMAYSIALWMGAHTIPAKTVTPPRGVAPKPSDNVEMLRKVGRDRLNLFETRVDALYGLVRLMNQAAAQTGAVRAPTAYLYGANDKIIPKEAALAAAARLPADAVTAYYPHAYHMILRDLHAQIVWDDILAFIKAPSAPLPSGAPPLSAAKNKS